MEYRNPLQDEIRRVITQLDLVSHVSARDYDSDGRGGDTSESKGGRRPPHGGGERPRGGAEASAYRNDYRHHSADYFRKRLEKAYSAKALQAILDEAKECLAAWKRSPRPTADYEWGSWAWKMEIVRESKEGKPHSEIARKFSVSLRSISRYVKDYSEALDILSDATL